MNQTSIRAGNAARTFHPAVIQRAVKAKTAKQAAPIKAAPIVTAKQTGLKIEALPFVKPLKSGRNYWNVKPSGSYSKDCATGHDYARAFIPHMRFNYGVATLGMIVRAMIDAKDESGLVTGFMGEIARATALTIGGCASIIAMRSTSERQREAKIAQYWRGPFGHGTEGTLSSHPGHEVYAKKMPLEKADKLADQLQGAITSHHVAFLQWAPIAVASGAAADAKFPGHHLPADNPSKYRAATALRKKMEAKYKKHERAMNRAHERCDQLVEQIKARAARGFNDLRARAFVMLHECTPGAFDHEGTLSFPDDDGGAARLLFDAAVQCAQETDFVQWIEMSLRRNVKEIAKARRDALKGRAK